MSIISDTCTFIDVRLSKVEIDARSGEESLKSGGEV